VQQRSQADATKNPTGYNAWSVIPGWEQPTSRLRCELADGKLDPWGMGMMFGIRQCNVYGMLRSNAAELVVSNHKPVTASDPEFQKRECNIVDQAQTEWWTKKDNAWFEIDLEQPFHIKRVEIQWWGISVAKSYCLLASDGGDFMKQRGQSDATKNPKGYNSWSVIPGWEQPTSRLRCELRDGSLDPWGMGMMFGIRQCNVYRTYCHDPTNAADVLKMAAICRLSAQTVETSLGATAADAKDRKKCLVGPLQCAVAYIHEKIDETLAKLAGRASLPIENLSLTLVPPSPGHIRVSSGADRAENLIDGKDSEWWTGERIAWIEVDLQDTCSINGLRIHWWGYSVAKFYKVLSSSDGISFKEQRNESDATSDGASCNPWSDIPGWTDMTTHVRMELADGQLDPWGMNKWFGIRQFNVMGRKGHPDFEDP